MSLISTLCKYKMSAMLLMDGTVCALVLMMYIQHDRPVYLDLSSCSTTCISYFIVFLYWDCCYIRTAEHLVKSLRYSECYKEGFFSLVV